MSDVVIAAIASGAIATVGTLGAVFMTQWFAERARSSIARERAVDRRAEREAEHRTWQRDRRADAYANLLTMAQLAAGYSWTNIYLLREGRPVADDIAPPTTEQFTAAMSMVNVVGSAEVFEMVRVWHRLYTEQVHRVNAAMLSPGDNAVDDELDDLQERHGKALKDLGDAMRNNLDWTSEAMDQRQSTSLMRATLAQPGTRFLSPEQYNQVFTVAQPPPGDAIRAQETPAPGP